MNEKIRFAGFRFAAQSPTLSLSIERGPMEMGMEMGEPTTGHSGAPPPTVPACLPRRAMERTAPISINQR